MYTVEAFERTIRKFVPIAKAVSMMRESNPLVARGCVLLLCFALGCSKQILPTPSSSAPKTGRATSTVSVAAAANLMFAFDKIETAFENQNPNTDIVVTYGASGNLFAQLTQRAPFDIFFSADTKYPRQLVDQGFARNDSYCEYASGRIVVWVAKDSPLDVEALGIRGVIDPSVKKIAIANPRLAPYGAAAEEALKDAGVYDDARDRLVFGETITQTAHFAESGAADVGILALALALTPEMMEKGRYWVIPSESHSPIDQATVILNSSKNPQAAKLLQQFVLGPEGQSILAEFGYMAPRE